MAAFRSSPSVEPGAALRPEYQLSSGERSRAGIAFVIQDSSGRKYMVSAAHVLMDWDEENAKEINYWVDIRRVILRTLDEPGKELASSEGPSLFVGSADLLKGPDGADDHTFDIAVRELTPDSIAPPLLLAARVSVGDLAWLVGCERGHHPGQHLYSGNISLLDHGRYRMKLDKAIDLRGFSGAPVVNVRGEVIGNLIDGDNGFAEGAPVSGIRQRLEENGLELRND